MKTKFTVLLFVLIPLFVFINNVSEAQEKKPYYIVFDNLDPLFSAIGIDGTNYTLWDYLYWNTPSSSTFQNYKDYIIRAPFVPNTFVKYNITQNFDFAVFPVGDYSLHATSGGMSIIDKIKEMLNNGKSVLLIGRKMLRQQSDPKVQQFFSELGIIYSGPTPLKNGPSDVNEGYQEYVINSVEDPNLPFPTMGGKKYGNVRKGINSDPAPPYLWYPDADFFRLEPNAKAKAAQEVLYTSPKVLAGLVYENEAGGRLYMYTVTWDFAIMGQSSLLYNTECRNIFDWFVSGKLKPEQYLELKESMIEFDPTNPGNTAIRNLSFRNGGRENLHITRIYLEDNPQVPGIFEITAGGTPKTLTPGEIHTVTIKFAPQAQDAYYDMLTIESNSIGGSEDRVSIQGSGGTQNIFGARISVPEFPINFGEMMLGEPAVMPIPITNIGTESLIISSIDIIDNPDGAFMKDGQWHMPEVITPEDTKYFPVRFFSTTVDKFGKFTARLKITSDAKNAEIAYIDMEANILPDFDGPQVVFELEVIQFGAHSQTKDTSFTLSNSGDQDLLVASVIIEGTPEVVNNDIFQIVEGNEGVVKPGEEHNIVVRFNPQPVTIDKEYHGTRIVVTTNSKVWGNKEIPISGTAAASVSVEDKVYGTSDILTATASPNPVSDKLFLTLEVAKAGMYDITIYDVKGTKVTQGKQDYYNDGSTIVELDFGNFANGVYYIVISGTSFSTQIPIIFQK